MSYRKQGWLDRESFIMEHRYLYTWVMDVCRCTALIFPFGDAYAFFYLIGLVWAQHFCVNSSYGNTCLNNVFSDGFWTFFGKWIYYSPLIQSSANFSIDRRPFGVTCFLTMPPRDGSISYQKFSQNFAALPCPVSVDHFIYYKTIVVFISCLNEI